MTDYRLDPKNLPRLTLEEKRRLDETPIDYSDIPELDEEFFLRAEHPSYVVIDPLPPSRIEWLRQQSLRVAAVFQGSKTMTDDPPIPLFGEDWLAARLLEIVCRHCGTTGDDLDSHGIPAHADLMRLCAEGGDIEITAERDGRMFATVTPEGRALLDQLRADCERDRERGAKP